MTIDRLAEAWGLPPSAELPSADGRHHRSPLSLQPVSMSIGC
jgi:hypothetical protein